MIDKSEKNNTININVPKLSKKDKEYIFFKLIKEIKNENFDYLLMESGSYKLLEDIKKRKNIFTPIKKYEKILLVEDYNVLRSASYVKKLMSNETEIEDKGKKIINYKKQIRTRFGKRGNTISNLYAAGYFDNLIHPLYQQLSKEADFTIEGFRKIFDKLVNEFPFAIFVNRFMGVDQIVDKLNKKIKTNKKYGIEQLNIHGINQDNCGHINSALELIEKQGDVEILSKEERYNVMLVSLKIK